MNLLFFESAAPQSPQRSQNTVIPNEASRRLFFAFTSCERVGSRREESLFDLSVRYLHSGLGLFLATPLTPHYCYPTPIQRTPMPFRFRKSASTLVLLSVVTSSVAAQNPQQTTGTKADVEKRLKAEEKPASAAPEIDAVVKTLRAAHRFAETEISPDGTHIAWVETLTGKDGSPNGNTSIYVKNLKANSAPIRITAGLAGTFHAEGNIAWSNDSKQFAFLSDVAKKDQQQLYVIAADGGVAKKLTHVKGFLDAPQFSPDNKTISVLFTENATRASGPLVAETAETGEIKDSFFEQRLALIDVATGSLRQISPADTYIYEYSWSSDGQHFVVTSAQGNGDNNWYIADLNILDVATGLMKSIYKPQLQIARPAWSPDGKHIAFIEGLMSDEPSVGGDIFLIPSAGGNANDITPGRKSSASWLTWTSDNKILFAEILDADSSVSLVDPLNPAVSNLWRGAESITAGLWNPNLSVSSDGTQFAVIRNSFSAPPEVWAGAIGQWQQITTRNKDLKPGWGDAKSIQWDNGGFSIQGWLIAPKDFDPSKKYPMVVGVHGGPGAAVQSSWPDGSSFEMALPATGYFLLLPNPRGSFGQGEAFTKANVKDFGYGDFADIMAGVDAALRLAPIDPDRLGLTGWSYGGYMTMWGVTQTNRFKAAMAGAGIANLTSYYGENKIDQWMIPFFGKSVYDDPEVYAKSSPINFIKKVKTPTLILVGDSDGECPTPQSYEFWHALKTQGVETTLVVYEHEGHHFSKPADDRDRVARTVAWFDAHLKQPQQQRVL
jgi:dipeptidyl aminopeptidase/acylaminoacyl peptidase